MKTKEMEDFLVRWFARKVCGSERKQESCELLFCDKSEAGKVCGPFAPTFASKIASG